MPDFTVEHTGEDGYGRIGCFDVPRGPVDTPAMFPVINLIGGSTLDSGSSWRHFRDNLLNQSHLKGTMFQAMSFLEYGVSPKNLRWWREERLADRLADRVTMSSPLFIDSGGFRLMNSDEFGTHPTEGGRENEWQIYTSPDSILKLQADFGGNIIATLDYPILRDLGEDEKTARMERSIESAVRCLELIEDPDLIEITVDEILDRATITTTSDLSTVELSSTDDRLVVTVPSDDELVADSDDEADLTETLRTGLQDRLTLDGPIDERYVDVVVRGHPSQRATIDKRELRSIEHIWDWKRRDNVPAVYVAIHGHNYETISWYVAHFLDRADEEGVADLFQGFAIGSLVPLRSKTDVLVDVVQGAKDAIPDAVSDEISLHVFGVGGKQASLLALLGVDTFDCSSHMQAASFRKYVIPGSWKRIEFDRSDDVPVDEFPCSLDHCPLCNGHLKPWVFDLLINRTATYGYGSFRHVLGREVTDRAGSGITKGWLYALLARHNFEVYNEEVRNVREAIQEGRLLEYVIEFARDHEQIKRGLKQAQVRDGELHAELRERKAYDLLAGPDIATDQVKLSEFGGGVDEATTARTISLRHTPSSFNVLSLEHQPDPSKEILLVIPCSKQKPYSDSRTHRAIFDRLEPVREKIHKLTISGLYGPVPQEYETDAPVLEYNYVLAPQDEHQIELVTDRLIAYLTRYGDQFNQIAGYATSKTYRRVIERAFDEVGRGAVYPTEPEALMLREHFRETNISELVQNLGVSAEEI